MVTIMKNMLKIILVFILIFALSTNAFASTVGIQWDYLVKVISELSISDSGTAYGSGTASTSNLGYIVSVQVNLQQLKSSGWTTIKTWNGSDSGGCSVGGYYAVISGYDYRTEVIAKVYDENYNKLEESKVYSSVKHY